MFYIKRYGGLLGPEFFKRWEGLQDVWTPNESEAKLIVKEDIKEYQRFLGGQAVPASEQAALT